MPDLKNISISTPVKRSNLLKIFISIMGGYVILYLVGLVFMESISRNRFITCARGLHTIQFGIEKVASENPGTQDVYEYAKDPYYVCKTITPDENQGSNCEETINNHIADDYCNLPGLGKPWNFSEGVVWNQGNNSYSIKGSSRDVHDKPRCQICFSNNEEIPPFHSDAESAFFLKKYNECKKGIAPICQ